MFHWLSAPTADCAVHRKWGQHSVEQLAGFKGDPKLRSIMGPSRIKNTHTVTKNKQTTKQKNTAPFQRIFIVLFVKPIFESLKNKQMWQWALLFCVWQPAWYD